MQSIVIGRDGGIGLVARVAVVALVHIHLNSMRQHYIFGLRDGGVGDIRDCEPSLCCAVTLYDRGNDVDGFIGVE